MAAPDDVSPNVTSDTIFASLITVPHPEHTFCPSSSTICGAGHPGFGQVEVLGCVVGLGGWGRAIGCGRRMGVGFGAFRLARRPTGLARGRVLADIFLPVCLFLFWLAVCVWQSVWVAALRLTGSPLRRVLRLLPVLFLFLSLPLCLLYLSFCCLTSCLHSVRHFTL